MAFRGKVDCRVRLHFVEQVANSGLIADIGPYKTVARITAHQPQRIQVAGVGQLIDIHHLSVRFRDQITAYRGPDEACAAGDYDTHRIKSRSLVPKSSSDSFLIIKVVWQIAQARQLPV